MAVPAHDSRDHEFALAFGLPMRLVVSPREGQDWDQKKAYAGDGLLVNSSYEIDLNGLSTVEAGMKVTAWLEKMGLGKKQVRRRILLVSHDFEALKGTADDHMLVCSNGCFIWSWAGQLQTTRLVICQTKILGRAFSSCPLRRLWWSKTCAWKWVACDFTRDWWIYPNWHWGTTSCKGHFLGRVWLQILCSVADVPQNGFVGCLSSFVQSLG